MMWFIKQAAQGLRCSAGCNMPIHAHFLSADAFDP